jgi:sulfatase modifying factor 1
MRQPTGVPTGHLPPRPCHLSLVMTTAMAIAGCGGGASSSGADVGTVPDPDDGGFDADDDGGPTLSHCPAAPDVRGPVPVRVRWNDGIAFCIDSTEVTNAQYAAFLAANASPGVQSSRCAWNQTFTPETRATNGPACPTFDGAGRADYPVVCIDWCDADAYCRWAGKRLCGKPQDLGGGPVADWTAKNASEWVIACTGDDVTQIYPYGLTPETGRCVDRLFPAATPALVSVGTATMCEGGVPGLFDMSGNAGEWQDDCVEQSTTGADDVCSPLGGSFSSNLAASTCISDVTFLRRHVAGDTGFRCCVNAQFF